MSFAENIIIYNLNKNIQKLTYELLYLANNRRKLKKKTLIQEDSSAMRKFNFKHTFPHVLKYTHICLNRS